MGGLPQIQLEHTDVADSSRPGPLLTINNLKVIFKKDRGFLGRQSTFVRAVDDLSFQLFESEFLSLVGESGSGKSTLARCISLLTRPTSGSIIYNGQDVLNLKGRNLLNYRRQVQIIYQDPFESLNPRQDVFTTISNPMRILLGVKDISTLYKNVLDLLQEVGLDPIQVIRKFPHQLSGGERQRVNIARALAPKPRLLIADEPITMLDATQRFNILSLLMNLKSKRNLTVMMITHDLSSAKLVSNRTIVMYLGKLVETGLTSDVISKPHHPYVELIMSSTPRSHWLSGGSKEEEFSLEESIEVRKGCNFAPRCKYVTEICRREEPDLTEKSANHRAACHNPINMN